MKLFHWNRAESLENYASGDIIVMAENIETARKTALEQFEIYMLTDENARYKWMFDMNGPDIDAWEDEDDREQIEEIFRKFRMDIARPPIEDVVAVFIHGSE
jgi:hypothetical protein